MINIEKITDEIVWNKQALEHGASFLQSWQWGEILQSEGKKIERLFLKENGIVVVLLQLVFVKTLFGWKYAFCPKGPTGEDLSKFFIAVKEYLAKQDVIFLRLEPTKIDSAKLLKTIDVNPSATLILDLQKSEDDLLSHMHEKTRYNIRLSQRKGLKVEKNKNLKIFLDLMKKTGSRDNFRLHETEHYEAILKSKFSHQLIVYSGAVPIATSVFVGFGETFTYLFGASDHDYRQLMAPYILQWQGIKLAKDQGCKMYDFFGVAPKKNDSQEYEFDEQHQYAGVSRFKDGFGGSYQEMPGTFDLVVDKFKYRLYYFLRRLRRLI